MLISDTLYNYQNTNVLRNELIIKGNSILNIAGTTGCQETIK